jgi:hypothetical protein
MAEKLRRRAMRFGETSRRNKYVQYNSLHHKQPDEAENG